MTPKPTVSFKITSFMTSALRMAVNEGVLCESDTESVQRVFDQITTPEHINRFYDGGPFTIVVYVDEAASLAGAVGAARDAYSTFGPLARFGGRRRLKATLTVLRTRIVGAGTC